MPRRRLRAGLRRGLALALLALLVLLSAAAAPPAAFGHAAFVGAEPQPGARLQTSPERVVLTFTEPLNRRLARANLLTADGSVVALEAQAATARRLVLRPKAQLSTGAYRVQWHTVSTEDGHALEGTYSFGVRAAATGGTHQLQQSPFARAGWIRVTLRAALYVTLLLFAAGLLTPALLRVGRGSWLAPSVLGDVTAVDADALRERERRVVGNLGWLAVCTAVATTLAEAADAAGGLSAAGMRDFLLTGEAGLARVTVVLCLLAAAFLAARRRGWAAGFAAAALLGVAASGHAASVNPRLPSIANDWLHLLGGAVWLGGIGLLALVWGPELRRGGRPARQAAARHVLPAFGRIALPAFLLVVSTGFLSLLAQIGGLETLWTTAYGRILLVKMTLVAVIAAASATHAWRLRPRMASLRPGAERRHWQLVRAEPVVGLGVVAAVAVLVAFPLPPRQLGEAADAVAAAPACDPCPLPRPGADELGVAERAGSQTVAAWLRRDGGRLLGTVRVSDRAGRPSTAPFEIVGARSRSCGPGCQRFSMPRAAELRVTTSERGRRFVASLAARWEPNSADAARRLLRRAERTMRGLRSVREVEQVTSGPGSYARTEYTLRAPDRMSFVTDRGARNVIIGERQWLRTADLPWKESSYGSGIPFSLRRWFRWTPYARTIRILDRGRQSGQRTTELALMDPATPVWFRLVVADRSGRVLRARMTARGHFMRARYDRFNHDLRVEAPDGR